MYIMIIRVVPEEMLERIPGKRESTMIIHSFQRRQGEEDNPLSQRHQSTSMSNSSSESIEDESFERMVVECTEGVGHVESVMPGMDVTV